MKKLLFILIFLNVSLWAQTHTWIQSTVYDVPQTKFVVYGDSVFFLENIQLNQDYKGFNGSITGNAGTNFYGTHPNLAGGSSYTIYLGGILFIYKDSLYNLWNGEVNNYGWQNVGAYQKYDFNGSFIGLSDLVNKIFAGNYSTVEDMTDGATIIGDSLFAIIESGGCGSCSPKYNGNNYLTKYSFTSNTWDGGTAIPALDYTNSWGVNQITVGSFNFGDTLYAITTKTDMSTINGYLWTQQYDSLASVYMRNPSTYIWSKIWTLAGAGIFMYGQHDSSSNSEYLLFESHDSTNANAGVWKVNGTTFTKLQSPPTNYRVVGFYLQDSLNYYMSVANSAVSDSNKLYRRVTGVWIDEGTASGILINNIQPIKNTLFISSLNRPSSIGVGTTTTVAYDTNFYHINITSPLAGYFRQSDSVQIKWTSDYNDSIYIYASYDSMLTWNLIKTSYSALDSTKILFGQSSQNTFIKIAYKDQSTIFDISQRLVVVNSNITITNVYLTATSSPTINIVAVIGSITSVNAFYSTDSVNWIRYGTFTIANQNIHLDTLSKQVNFAVNGQNSYYKLVEVKDTAIYGLTTPIISQTGFGLEGTCYAYTYHGLGIAYNFDPGCGWVNDITKAYGTSLLNVAGDGTLSITQSQTAYPSPYTDMPDNKTGIASAYTQFNSSSPFMINGREFWFSSYNAEFETIYQLWMKDLVNNVSYVVATLGSSFGPSPVWIDGYVQAAYYGGYLLFSSTTGYPSVFDIQVMDYPPTNLPAITSQYHLLGSPSLAYYKNYFRGISPKMPVNTSGGK